MEGYQKRKIQTDLQAIPVRVPIISSSSSESRERTKKKTTWAIGGGKSGFTMD
jgi:hypothetical protein